MTSKPDFESTFIRVSGKVGIADQLHINFGEDEV
jgi:hypothetical protein